MVACDKSHALERKSHREGCSERLFLFGSNLNAPMSLSLFKFSVLSVVAMFLTRLPLLV